MKKKISVIIPTYHDWIRLRLCVNALDNQSFPKEDFEVIIVNNDPLDPAPEDFILPANVTLIWEAEAGSYSARNAGISLAQGEILAFTDSDCIPDSDWLKNAHDAYKNDSIDLIGGRINIFREKKGSYIIYTYEKYTSFRQEINVPKGNGVTANFFVKKSIAQSLGGFNQELKSGGDWEFTQRCVSKGYNFLYQNNVIVNHPARPQFKDLLKKEKRITSWGIISIQKKSGNSILYIVIRQFKNGVLRLIFQQRRGENLKEKSIIIFVGSIKIWYRLFVGIMLLFKFLEPKKIRS